MPLTPKDYVHFRSTPRYTQASVPEIYLNSHSTKVGVLEQFHVLTGRLKFYGYHSDDVDNVTEVIIAAGERAISRPLHFHKIELIDADTEFTIHFFAHKDSPLLKDSDSPHSLSCRQ